ncbi:hypothetical protein [Hymenobacter sp.]|jgi:hypothetical protein|uniref:hypothetical protein n=1 Tax=Hymenobacter sp. TaxID=1898978 RepID=UPI002EDAE8C0
MRHTYHFLLLLLLLAGMLTACNNQDCGCVPPPGLADSQLLHTWQLDKILGDGQVISSGNDIKDRYTLAFKAQHIYTQTILATGTEFNGTWKLTSAGHSLELTDHKGDIQTYSINGSWPNGGSQPEQILLHQNNNAKETNTLEFGLIP